MTTRAKPTYVTYSSLATFESCPRRYGLNALFHWRLSMLQKPTRVSYSAIATFEECPAEYHYDYISGERIDASSPALNKGNRLHKNVENYLKGDILVEQLATELYPIRDYLVTFKQLEARSEEVWLVNRDWEVEEQESENTFIKAITDVHYLLTPTLFIVDLKSGQRYPEHADQLHLYALMGLVKYPEAEKVMVSALYLDGPGPQYTYHRKDLEGLKLWWTARANRVLDAIEYPPTPSASSCKWCSYAKSKKGPCEHG